MNGSSSIPPVDLSPGLADKRDQLLAVLRAIEAPVVALSAGVDSAVVAQAAQLAQGSRALAVTARSASLAEGELELALALAAQIGIAHRVIDTAEFDNPRYVANAPDRCYHCKSELYTRLEQLAAALPGATILNGANLDDQGDYRPGMQAASEHRVRSPLIEVGLNKAEVRELARHWSLPVWDKPATPCLSSRVAYGEAVSPERLAMIDAAEQFLRAAGLGTVRVRYHQGDIARIEVPAEALAQFGAAPWRAELVARFRALGFRYITLDLEGFRSGSLNAVLPLEALQVLPGARRRGDSQPG